MHSAAECVELSDRPVAAGEGASIKTLCLSSPAVTATKTIHYSHPCSAIICPHTETTPTPMHCVNPACGGPLLIFHKACHGREHTPTGLITHTHITHSRKPSADPPVKHTHTHKHLLAFADSAWSAGPHHSEPTSGREVGNRLHGSREVVEGVEGRGGGPSLGIKEAGLYTIL